MLMDLFYSSLTVPKKRRVHFHSFMADVHLRVHELKKAELLAANSVTTETNGERVRRLGKIDTNPANDPIKKVATSISEETSVLCFDEFQVTDVADALILRSILSTIFANGTVVVATSNRPTSDLYLGGLNRDYFVPAIEMLDRHCIGFDMNSEVDYRMVGSESSGSGGGERDFINPELRGFPASNFFFHPISATSGDLATDVLTRLLAGDVPVSTSIPVLFNRSLTVNISAPSKVVCSFDFPELCKTDLASSDFRSLAQTYTHVILRKVPTMNIADHNQARRFITLIDELYEAKVSLICEAEEEPGKLFSVRKRIDPAEAALKKLFALKEREGEGGGGGGEGGEEEEEDISKGVDDMKWLDVRQSGGSTLGELASVKELKFAFKRAASRLVQMTSVDWFNEQEKRRNEEAR
jgi:protein AFG1